jgi:hypothetical protein
LVPLAGVSGAGAHSTPPLDTAGFLRSSPDGMQDTVVAALAAPSGEFTGDGVGEAS